VVGRIDFVAEVMVGGGWECYIMVEVVMANNEGCGCGGGGGLALMGCCI
jgi:hypothetical protein